MWTPKTKLCCHQDHRPRHKPHTHAHTVRSVALSFTPPLTHTQDLANRLLAAEPLRADLRAVGAAQDAASPRAYLHPTAATFLPPAGDPAATTSGNPAAEPPLDAAAAGAASSRAAGGWNAEYGATSPATAEDGGDVVRMLAAALGPELAAECGLTEAVAALEAAAAGGGRAVLPPQAYKAGRTPKDEEFYVDFRNLQVLLCIQTVLLCKLAWRLWPACAA